MSVKERKINTLLALFKERDIVSVEEIKEKLQIKDRSVKSYIRYIRDLGIDVIHMNQIFRLAGKESTNGSVMNIQDVRIIKVMLTIGSNNGKFNKRELVNEICISFCDKESISRKTVERTIKFCEENGYIYLDENSKYRLSVETETFHITNDDEIFKFMELCNIYKEHIPFYNDVNKLKNKIIEQTGYEDTDCDVYCIGRGYNCSNVFKNILNQFESFDYRRKTLKIGFNSKIGDMTVSIEVITLLYHWENDKSYAVGMVENNLYFINIDTIYSIEEIESPNHFYNNKDVMNKLDLMFGASMDRPYQVKVEFDNIFNIYEKLFRMSKRRKKSNILLKNNKIIYTDTIYGIYDFAMYLRSFGSACKVLEPQELRDIMRKTYERILQNYGVMKNE